MEDDLSEYVLRRLLLERPVIYAIGPVFKRTGFGYLKKQTPAFNNLAKACPVLLLTDLDKRTCAPELMKDWLGRPKHNDFLFRIAVREVEAWLLAMDAGLGAFLGVRQDSTTSAPESLLDPKAELLRIANASPRREKREALVRCGAGGQLRQGPAYNSTLADFVNQAWLPHIAEQKCQSLRRLTKALAVLETDWKSRVV